MTETLRIGVAQLNFTVGDLSGNERRIVAAYGEATVACADLVVFPELSICGYPPEDLVLKPLFLSEVESVVARLAAVTRGRDAGMVVSAPWTDGGRTYNAVMLLHDGAIAAIRYKRHLPNYRVFDEKRVFAAGPLPEPVDFRGVRLGLPVCEDIWFEDVTKVLAASGAELLLVPNGSPFEVGKGLQRLEQANRRVAETGLPLVYVNQMGGQDELVFDGDSFVLDGDGALAVRLPLWREALVMTDWARGPDGWRCTTRAVAAEAGPVAQTYNAVMTGLRDYVGKNGFPGVLLGMSGGIDSALTAAIAADALGPDRVLAVMMPSPYTSRESLDDAADCCRRLGVRLEEVGIGPAMEAFGAMLKPLSGPEGLSDITAQNVQSRARGLTLMALSNQHGRLLLTTGNKSEMAVGYATLYGDMCGGFNPIKDVYKTAVYELCAWRNAIVPDGSLCPAPDVLPANILTKAPTAELKPGQTDQDSLPPYPVLDDILHGLVEDESDVEMIVARGHERGIVLKVWRMLQLAEYKRRQAAPGVKISSRAFGRERRYPITNSFLPGR